MTPVSNSPIALKALLAAAQVASRVNARIAGRLVTRLWFTPWRLPLGKRALAKQDEWLEQTVPLEVHAGGRVLKGYEGGRGPTVVLVHGWGDSSRSMGAFVRPLIERGFRVVAVDAPGHGATSGGQSDGLQIAAAVRAVADATGPVYAVVAHSLGAHATMVALRDGLEIERAVLISPSVFLESAVEPFVRMFGLSDVVIEPLRSEIERRFGRSVWGDLAAPHLVRDVRLPALVMHDPEDPQVPFADAERLVASWDGAALEKVNGLGHTRILRDPHVIQRAVSFLVRDSDESARADEENRVPAEV
ncbi:MAG: alpha/beta hydrolase [Actinomycetota bacterium]|nr:alpha/beta hydrolase [Actinomycetota bacterium]